MRMKKKIGYALIVLILVGIIIKNVVLYGFLMALVYLILSVVLSLFIVWLIEDKKKNLLKR
jgi:hypothetical protein